MKVDALKRNGDFVRAYKRGKSYVHPFVVLYINKNKMGHTRVGITASKKIGGAVQRNRARRIIRCALAQVMAEDTRPVDMVFVARGKTPHIKSTQLIPAMIKLFKEAGLPVKGE